jgi:hypothetical protein
VSRHDENQLVSVARKNGCCRTAVILDGRCPTSGRKTRQGKARQGLTRSGNSLLSVTKRDRLGETLPARLAGMERHSANAEAGFTF